ncbi:MAG: hypothetical protein WD669_04135 [Pirellulales bacterium]
MSEILQEYVDSGNERLRVDRAAGIIRGVKLLGLVSRNGRRYREGALVEATGLYEGAKVNINHPKGHPLSPRDYQDRLGVIRGVQFRGGDGLFGDLHFNPKHALSEQLVWDAEHAPQNVGLSHNVLARTTKSGDDTVVEAITKVQSIDLVADPATTAGLFEHETPGLSDASAGGSATDVHWDALTIEQLELHRPDLLLELRRDGQSQLEVLRRRLDESSAREAASQRRQRIDELLVEHGLPLPSNNDQTLRHILSDQFIETLMNADDDKSLRRLVAERAELVRSARRLREHGDRGDRQPRSRDQASLACGTRGRCQTAAEFVAAVRGR